MTGSYSWTHHILSSKKCSNSARLSKIRISRTSVYEN